LRPREGQDIRVETAELRIAPARRLRWRRDAYDKAWAVVDFLGPARRLSIELKAGRICDAVNEWRNIC
jgi:hypothetical protein